MGRGNQTLSGLGQPQVPLRSEWYQNGFVSRADTITFTNGSETFEIAPASSYFDFYVEGYRHRSDGDTLVTDGTDGQHWIYYDAAGAIQELVNPSHAQLEDAIENQCLIAMVYWNNNTSEGYLFDERHGMWMSPATHRLMHECIGMLWAEGVAVNGIETDESGAANSHAQFGNTSGEVYDEDVSHNIDAMTDPATYECWWWDGTRWQWDTNAGYPFLVGGTPRLQYNTGGALAEVGNGQFALVHLFATSAADGDPIIIVGQATYATITGAREGAASEVSTLLLGTLPSPEMKPMATVIFQSSNGYGNDMKTRARTVSGGHDYVDWRNNPVSPGGGTVNDHGSLSGLSEDDHSGHPWLLGREGGQILKGGTLASENLDLYGTAHATPGDVRVISTTANVGLAAGNAYLGPWVGAASYLTLAHTTVRGTSGSYAIIQDSAGQTYLNSAAGQHLHFRIGNAAKVGISSAGYLGVGVAPSSIAYPLDIRGIGSFFVTYEIRIDPSAAAIRMRRDGINYIRVGSSSGGTLSILTNNGTVPGLFVNASGDVGVKTSAINTSTALEIDSTTGALLSPRMTTAQVNALTATNGMIVYDSTTNQFKFRENGAWVTGSGLA